MKIFLLEDDFSLNKIIRLSLENKGLFVESYENGYDAITNIINNKYDLFILDLNVIGFNGHKVLEEIRKNDTITPVIIISAEIDINHIKRSYDLGCNDYIKKPFDFEELFLRIQYHLKSIFLKQKTNDFLINLAYDFSFDLIEQRLYKSKHEIELTTKEKLLLSLFVNNIGSVVTIEMIHEYVWNSKEMEAVSMRSVVHKIKKKLKNGIIINQRGVGYKLLKL